MPFVGLNDALGSKVIEFYFGVMGAGCKAISQGVKLDLMDHSRMLAI